MILVETYLLNNGEKKRKQTNRRTDRQTPSQAPALVPTPSTGFDPDWVYVSLHETRRTTTLYLPNGFLAKFELARICLCISKNCKSVSSCGQYFPFLAKWIMNYKCLCILWQYFIYVFPCFCTYSKNTRNFVEFQMKPTWTVVYSQTGYMRGRTKHSSMGRGALPSRPALKCLVPFCPSALTRLLTEFLPLE